MNVQLVKQNTKTKNNLAGTEIGLGLAALGRPEYINLRSHPDADKSIDAYRSNALRVMDYAYKNKIRHFDTAASYGKGEEFLLEWNNKHGYKDVKLSSKWGYSYVANWEIGFKGQHEIKEHSLAKLQEQWIEARKLLPALKLYQIHSATFESGILENADVLNALYEIKESTGVKLGLSVSGVKQSEILETALNIKIKGKTLFDSFQATFNILEQSTFRILQKIMQHNKKVIVKEGLANGRLFENKNYLHYKKLYDLLDRLSNKYGVGVDAIALRFIMDFLEPQLVLSGASTINQLNENIQARKFVLNKSEVSELQSFSSKRDKYWRERSLLLWH
jgi:aryl-alcohol dehydrogenase-like predicted oxidoreductase